MKLHELMNILKEDKSEVLRLWAFLHPVLCYGPFPEEYFLAGFFFLQSSVSYSCTD